MLSIIMALRNNRTALEKSLRALAGEPAAVRDRINLHVIDSNSGDAPFQACQTFADDLNIRFVSEYDSGIYNAWNKGIRSSTGDFLTFLGAGDIFLPNALEKLLLRIREQPDFDIMFARARLVYSNGRRIVVGKPFASEEFGRWFSVAHSGCVYRRSLFDKYGNFDESFKITGDYDFISRVKAYSRVAFIDEVLTEFPMDGISSTSVKPLKEAFLVRRRHKTVSPIHNRLLYVRALAAFMVSRLR